MLKTVRDDFPMLKQTMHGKPLIYFDSAATSLKPQCVIDAVQHYYGEEFGTVHRAVYEMAKHSTENYYASRVAIQQFLNAEKPEEIILTRGTTESINLVAVCFGKAFINHGDEILITEMEHHSNIVPWQMLCQERGCILKVVPITEEGEIDLEAFEKLLSEKTRLVSLCHMSNVLGTVNPVKKLIELAHEKGAKVLLDGAQAATQLAVDVQDLNCDFYVFSGHKLFGPTGIGVLYGKKELLEQFPPYQGGGDMIDHVTFEKTTYNSLPLKLEAGTPMIAQAIGLSAAIRYLNEVTLDWVEWHENELLSYATARLLEIPGLRIIGTSPSKGSIISFTVDGVHHLDLGTMLDLRGIAIRTGHHCAQPLMQRLGLHGTARLSLSIYNTLEEIDQFAGHLQEVIQLLK